MFFNLLIIYQRVIVIINLFIKLIKHPFYQQTPRYGIWDMGCGMRDAGFYEQPLVEPQFKHL